MIPFIFSWHRASCAVVSVVALALFLSLGCGQRREASPMSRMAFEVDTTRLGERVQSATHGIRFRPPMGWLSLPDERVAEMQTMFQGTGDSVHVQPLYVFSDTTTSSTLIVATLDVPGSGSIATKIDRYAATLQDALPGDSLQRDTFLKDDVPVTQFFTAHGHHVNFLLVVPTQSDQMLQFNYVVPKAHYNARQAKFLESSIGSIQFTHSTL